MPKKKNNELSEPLAALEVTEAPEEPRAPAPTKVAEAPPAKPQEPAARRVRAKKARAPRTMTFARYAKTKGLKTTHIPGMRAFCDNPNRPRTKEAWDAFFKDY